MTSLFNLNGKTALVTGGSKGIGLGMARALGKAGAKIAIASRKMEDLEKAALELKENGILCHFFQVDVTNKQQVGELVNEVVDHFGTIDILVNNAGMNIRKPLIEIDEEDWDKVQTTNLKGMFLVGQAVAKQMMKQGSGRMINISSILGGVGMSFQSSYAASKGGVDQLTRVWASELADSGITVNAIAPAYIKTPMTEEWLSDRERYNHIINQTMLKRVGELSDLDGPVIFLASDASSYVTGQILYVDGGWTAK
ncbi:glucose 1-dehydrogenase [bacterium LRH843]|nr:glucose 1-dehydrogenase [bacterium LRH843]